MRPHLRNSFLVFAYLLQASSVGAQSGRATQNGYIAVDSSRLYFEECGSGSPVVLIHDGLMGAASWDLVWENLCAHAHVLRYDRRGVGHSTDPKVSFSHSADLEAVLVARQFPAATVVGSSSGGGIAIDFALDHPERVVRLVLLGPVLNGMPYSAHFTQRDLRNIEPLSRGDVAAAIANQLNDPYALQPGNDAVRRKVRETLEANPQNLRSLLTVGRFLLRPTVPAAARLSELRAPVLIMVGEHDIPDVHAHSGAIEYGAVGVRREIVADGGHLIQLDHPSVVGPRILEFIAQAPIWSNSVEREGAIAGTYTITNGPSVVVFKKDQRLMIHSEGARDLPLFAANDSTYYVVASHLTFQMTFRQGPTGIVGADIDLNGTHLRADRKPQ